MTDSVLQTKGMDEAPETIAGNEFKQAREAAGLSRADVAARLNLTESYIEFIETEQFARLPMATFAKGYIRQYAKYLRLSDTAMIKRYEAYTAELVVPSKSAIRIHSQVKPSDPLVKWATFAIVCVVLALSMLWWTNLQDDPSVSDSAMQEKKGLDSAWNKNDEALEKSSLQDASPRYLDENTEESVIVREEDGGESDDMLEEDSLAEVEGLRTGAAPNRLEAIFQRESWIEVKDGQQRILFTGTKKAGETLQLETLESFNLVIGNPAALTLSYNGTPVDLADYIRNREVARLTLGQN
ncbi:MAG: DUF4115 domain-containing protein [Pseudomonadales bacterium]|nr:DUF4115 domain-containing protein [Pseudomonadales bacterium]